MKAFKQIMLGFLLLLPVPAWAAIDSYSFFHVTIETPWMIFLFLLVFIFAPLILMVILYWHFAFKKPVPDYDQHQVSDDMGDKGQDK